MEARVRYAEPPPRGLVRSDLVGCVLAGGLSTRMGRDKSTLIDPRTGRSLVDGAATVLAAVPCSRVVVSGRHGTLEAIPDETAGRGPMAGVAAVLDRVDEGTAAIFLPVDMPLLLPSDLASLASAVDGGARAACFEGWPIPFAVRVDATIRTSARDASLRAGRGASVFLWLEALGAHLLSCAEASARLRSLDTAEAWDEFLAQRPPEEGPR